MFPPMLSYLGFAAVALGLLFTAYRAYRDFHVGDYHREVAEAGYVNAATAALDAVTSVHEDAPISSDPRDVLHAIESSRGGEGGIRTRGGCLAPTRFPGVRLKPLIHLSCARRS